MPQKRERPTQQPNFSTDRSRWAAVVSRNTSADGTFYTCVLTTGIYCRPSCPARRPHRANVEFYSTSSAAEAAGFRPCKRCRPDQPSMESSNAAKVAHACRMIETADREPSLRELAAATDLSPYHFHRVFRAVAGVTPKAYAVACRQQRVRTRLPLAATVTEAIYDTGFQSNGRFYADSTEVLGMTPTELRNGGRAIDIRFAIDQCSLGAVLVAASEKGICAISLGDSPERLRSDLEQRFPRARLIGGDKAFQATVAQVIALVEAPRRGLDLPLDIRGTAFQHRVWQALRAVPAGTTVTYGEIAARIGAPKAVRAVASACAANAIAVAVPCHRVVRAGGALSGYRWGVARKRLLLDREAD